MNIKLSMGLINKAILNKGLVLTSLLVLSSMAQALPVSSVETSTLAAENIVVQAATDCTSSANQVVEQTGGQLLSATPTTQNGQAVCKVTVLVKSSDGQRPKKMSVTVPQ